MTAVAVYGLENLQKKQLQVDQEANLLDGLTFAEGLTLQKVEIEADGIRTEVSAPEAYTPDYPGSVNLILTIVKPDGSTLEVTSDRLTVAPLDYQAPALAVVDIITEKYSWYNNLNDATRDFIKPRILLSYYVLNRYTKGDRLHIIL